MIAAWLMTTARVHDSRMLRSLLPAFPSGDRQVWADSVYRSEEMVGGVREGIEAPHRFQGQARQVVELPPDLFEPCRFKEPLPGGACLWFNAHGDAGGGDAVHRHCPCACLDWPAHSVLQQEAVWLPGEAGRVLIEGRSVSGW